MTASILVSGAGIAGPALAYWLNEYGFDVTVVEKAPDVRRGGQPVDFKGATHRTVLSRMGILDDVRRVQVGSRDGTLVDARGRTIGTVPGEFSGGEINVPRGDLANLLYERTARSCEYLFDDSIASLTDTAGGVAVRFDHAAPRRFDLVVGADGIHSNVRKLAFGRESVFVSHLGYYYAQFDVDGDADEMYNEPGRMAAVSGGEDPALFVFKSAPLHYERDDVDRQKELLIDAYRGGSWKIPELLAQVPTARNFWMDSISRVTTDRYACGRVALVGDSAYGNALGGFGTGLSIVGAYVLAGELAVAGGDYTIAYRQYEAKFRQYAKVSQKVNAGRLLAPSTRIGIRARNALFSASVLFLPLMTLTDRFATDIDLEDYGSRLGLSV
jgi:2-polyprenyl-6-methoxyphenol hydroxylase-like FAD-dependent oxidoreductase